jgi:pyrroloquinoline-quinone synthase
MMEAASRHCRRSFTDASPLLLFYSLQPDAIAAFMGTNREIDMTRLTTSSLIDSKVSERAMLKHPFYQAWTEGRLPIDTLRAYARQYFHHVEAFPSAVSAVHSACPDREGRRMLAENLAEEEGIEEGKQDHASLWLMFACGLGESEDKVRSEKVNGETRALIDTFRTLSRRSYASGLGALYAYESQFPAVASAKIEGLVDRYGISEEETLRFFRVHERADVEHSAVCRALLDRLSKDEKAEAVAAGEELAGALWNFLSGVEARASVN